MGKVFHWLALFAFVGGTMVHLLTFVPNLPISADSLAVFYVAMSAVLMPFWLYAFGRRLLPWMASALLHGWAEGDRQVWDHWWWPLPRRVKITVLLCCACLVISLVVSFTCSFAVQDGCIEEVDGRYVVMRDGIEVRDATEQEYSRGLMHSLRVMSTLFMNFFLFSMFLPWGFRWERKGRAAKTDGADGKPRGDGATPGDY